MSQWGFERTINGARMQPLLDGPAFQDAMPMDRILDVLLIDDGGDLERARATLRVAQRNLRDKPYRAWADFTITLIDPKQPNA